MNLSFTIYNILILVGCIQGLLLSLLFFKNNNFKRKSNGYMALTLVSFSLNNFYYFLMDIGVTKSYPIFFFVPLAWGLLIPFALYYFVQYLINPSYNAGQKYYWLLFPFFSHFLFQLTASVLFLAKSPVLFHHFQEYSIISIGIEIFSMLYSLVMLIIIYLKITNYQQELKENYSNINKRTLSWLRNLIVALSGLWCLWSFPYLYELFTDQFLQWHHYPLWIGMSIAVYWIGYSTYSRTDVFQAPLFVQAEENSLKPSPILSEKVEEHHHHLMEVMKVKRPYLNPDLDLEMLAREIDLSAGYLSQIINKKEKVSFYDFINRHRVDEAKRIMSDPKFDHYSILAIGMEAGFNSKSTFNAAFKKHSHSTPSEFKKQLSTMV